MEYDMEEFVEQYIEKYSGLAGRNLPLKSVQAPLINEDHKGSPAGAPGKGPVQECLWRFHTCPPRVLSTVAALEADKAKAASKSKAKGARWGCW